MPKKPNKELRVETSESRVTVESSEIVSKWRFFEARFADLRLVGSALGAESGGSSS